MTALKIFHLFAESFKNTSLLKPEDRISILILVLKFIPREYFFDVMNIVTKDQRMNPVETILYDDLFVLLKDSPREACDAIKDVLNLVTHHDAPGDLVLDVEQLEARMVMYVRFLNNADLSMQDRACYLEYFEKECKKLLNETPLCSMYFEKIINKQKQLLKIAPSCQIIWSLKKSHRISSS